MIIFSILFFLPFYMQAAPELVDEVVAIVFGGEKPFVITRSDVRPGLDGAPRQLRQVIVEQLMILDAQKLKISITEEDVDRYLMQAGYSSVMLENLFEQLGYSLQEGRQLLKNRQMVEMIVDYRVRSDKRMMVSSDDVREFCTKYPEYIPMSFELKQAFIPYEDHSLEAVQEAIKKGTIDTIAQWQDSFIIDEHDLAEEKVFLKTAQEGSIVEIDPQEDGVELTRLVERTPGRERTFEERKDQVEFECKKERFFSILADYEKRLLKEASLRFMHDEDKREVMGL